MNSDLLRALIDRIRSEEPKTVLILAPDIPSGLQDCFSQSKDVKVTHILFSRLESEFSGLGRFDFIVIFDSFSSIAKQTTEQMISRLRDLHAKLLWVMINDDEDAEGYRKQDAVAQGFRLVDPNQFGKKALCWYEFSLHFYKPVPQWLNAKNWANPDQWNKSRW